MSYDLVVFEKSKAPVEAAKFLAWYEKQTEWGGDYDYNDISHASPDLQKFFHKIRTSFPPMNGAFAPSNEELSGRPDLEERLCDYCIGEDMIYLSLAYSVADRAYELVKRAAYFTGVGFYDPSDGSAVPNFFESRYPMLLEGEGFQPVEVSDFDSISEKLDKMTVKNRSYLYLTDQIGSYIQVGGYGDSFTVEKHVYVDCLFYTYQKAEYRIASQTNEKGSVMIAGNQVKVKRQQILSGETVRQLFYDFFQMTKTMDSVEWVDMQC
ncbi:MAG: hypothetical protein K2M91_07330 [Lachnospiraceae bacterium]|nr:hypothetical protein [Lachnospiraceae bacterium]